jgi:hypothetical protein
MPLSNVSFVKVGAVKVNTLSNVVSELLRIFGTFFYQREKFDTGGGHKKGRPKIGIVKAVL